ncbi:MAG: undecaprenyldiphospho-muramoylpentapeptide beta-N-acetylglucosaminyltransferase [Clostridiales bacterium]|nr:MAG: undecaprenyldiphospho-muramoylpentapeptide beta-N-acetylglucosaminyltransferase [Clostridiales bacterium]
MKIMLAGGGTAGHINPAIAIAKYVRKRRPSAEIVFIGADNGMENKLVPAAGFELKTFPMSGMMRGLTPKAFAHNLKTVRLLFTAMKSADRIIDEFRPDIIVGTGGFACFPPLYRGAKRGIPTVIHESNVLPGRTNRLLGRYVDKILLGFEDGAQYFKDPEKLEFTGNPLREGMVFTKKEEVKRALGIEGSLVYSAFGSLGAREMNTLTAELFAIEEKEHAAYRHIHSTGSLGYRWMPERVASLGVDLAASKRIDMREYVFDAPAVLAAADLMICRAGAMTMSEVCATGTPAIIVPSPNVADDHQRKNARALSDRGAAVFFEEKGLTAQKLYDTIQELLADKARLAAMSEAALALAVFDAEEHIYRCIMEMTAAKPE